MDNKKNADEREQEVLNEFLSCSTVCADLGKVSARDSNYSSEQIDYLIHNIPGFEYVLNRMLNYIFSNGLTTGSENEDLILDEWLYERKNKYGSTNYAVLREAIGLAIVYGECGLRMYEGNIYVVKPGKYRALYTREDGIDEIVAYFIREDGKDIETDYDIKDWSDLNGYGDIETYFRKNGMILLGTDEFLNMRNDTTLHGHSPLLRDKLRINLLMSVYERLNYDINYDGPGRIILRPRDGYLKGEDNDISTGEIMSTSVAAQEKRVEEAKREIKRVGEQIKNSASDSVVLLSNAFSDNIDHLPRVTKATEFFGWIENESALIAQVLGMSPTLLELGKLHGNVSVEKIIDNAMLNTVIPTRELYATQFSKMISDELGVRKVYFDKYDMEQVQDENDVRYKVSAIIKGLSVANKNSESEDIQKLIDEFSELLRSSIYNENGQLKPMQ